MRTRIYTFFAAVLALLFLPGLAAASHGGPHAAMGYSLSAISHDETTPLVLHQKAILAMVDNILATESLAPEVAAKLAALVAYSADEYAEATSLPIPMWLALRYDWVPTHITAHATAAANNEMLLMLQKHVAHRTDTMTFIDSINTEMMFMLAPCAYSALPFVTTEHTMLDWTQFNAKALPVIAAAAIALMLASILVIAVRRRQPVLSRA